MKILESIHDVLLSILGELKEIKEQNINITLSGKSTIKVSDLNLEIQPRLRG